MPKFYTPVLFGFEDPTRLSGGLSRPLIQNYLLLINSIPAVRINNWKSIIIPEILSKLESDDFTASNGSLEIKQMTVSHFKNPNFVISQPNKSKYFRKLT